MKKPKIRDQYRIKNAKSKGLMAILLVGVLLISSAIALQSAVAASPPTVLLGTAADFSVLAGSGITNTGPTTIHGDVGTYPTPTEVGFGSVTLDGTNHGGDGVTQQAKTDLVTAYDDAAGRIPPTTIPTELGGNTLSPGVYNSSDGTFGITGTVTLDGQGDPNAVFIFQMQSTLVTASDSVVFLTNGTHSCNVFWQVGSSATIGTRSSFVGTILALTSITLTTNATVDGRVLARNGAVTMDSNTIGQTVHIEGITLTPKTATNPVGTNHTITATVAGTGDPVPNRNVNFTVVSGPNAGLTGSNITDINGHATFTYQGNTPGLDTIQAAFENSQGSVVTSSTVTKNWTFSGPAISVLKQISTDNSSWVDADLPPGIAVTVGLSVYYKFTVSNIGNENLENITLTDNTYTLTELVVPPTLAPDAFFTYYLGPVTAELGQHTNIANVTAQFDNTNYTSTNNANYNGIPSEVPSISVVKEISVNNSTWVDANVLPGISVSVGSNLYYRFNVTNTGTVSLSSITLADNTYTLTGLVTPSTLAPNESFIYYFGPVQALVGQHTNTATATGQYDSVTYNDTDNANYIAAATPGPSITVIKWISSDNTTWVDANTPPGINVTAGSNLYFKFEVTNTGNVTFTCITLKDSSYKLCNLFLPSTLAPNVTFTYILGPVQAQAGQHTDTATATGKYNCKVYCDTDNATYFAPTPTPSINVIKSISSDNTTWVDANTAPGINVSVGQNVYFKFEINNTGDVALSCITLKDNTYKLCNLVLPSTLAPNTTFTYYLGPIQAQAGQHTDTATASGKYNNKIYCGTDNANYWAPTPTPAITVTKMVSSDNLTWVDANTAPGLNVSVGSNLYFKFEVNNTGDVALSCITLKDSTYKLCNLVLPSTLAPNETFTYVLGPVTALQCQQSDTATASGKYNNKVYCTTDKAYYYGTPVPTPALQITKYVSCDGRKWSDANTAPGLIVSANQNVTFKFVIKNTGNVMLTNIMLEDQPYISPTQVAASLQPCQSVTWTSNSFQTGLLQQFDNATAQATYNETTYTANDVAYYYGSLCTYNACDYKGTGAAANLLKNSFTTAFPQGLTVGNYTQDGYGYNWTSITSLKSFLKLCGTNGAITRDVFNPTTLTYRGGTLAVQTATLNLNLGFSALNLQCMPSGLQYLTYDKTGDALDGKTVSEILDIANAVLGGAALPSGYTYNSLTNLVTQINGAFVGCQPSCWALTYLENAPV